MPCRSLRWLQEPSDLEELEVLHTQMESEEDGKLLVMSEVRYRKTEKKTTSQIYPTDLAKAHQSPLEHMNIPSIYHIFKMSLQTVKFSTHIPLHTVIGNIIQHDTSSIFLYRYLLGSFFLYGNGSTRFLLNSMFAWSPSPARVITPAIPSSHWVLNMVMPTGFN